MKLLALFEFNKVDKVEARDLLRLIATRQVHSFKRSDGWVTVGKASLRREHQSPTWDGPERREIRQRPLGAAGYQHAYR